MGHDWGARAAGLICAITALALGAFTGSAGAAALTLPSTATGVQSTSGCAAQATDKLFATFGDANQYMALPGDAPDSFTSTGWTLSGGASVETTLLADGRVGPVLNLPSGSSAVSPAICLTTVDPVMRTMVRDVTGAEGVQFYVSYQADTTWTHPRNTGQVHGQQTAWTLSNPTNLQPANGPEWQVARFVFVAGGQRSDFQVYDLFVDPRMHD